MRQLYIRPGDPWLAARRPFLRLLAEAAAQSDADLELEEQFGHQGRLHRKQRPTLPVFGNALGVNPDAAAALAADKDYTARLLAGQGLPTPPGILIFGPAYQANMRLKNLAVADALAGEGEAQDWADAKGYPVIVKPNGGSEGRGISRATDRAALASDLKGLFATDQKIRIEAPCLGHDHRIVVWDGAVKIAYRRDPAQVTGDGTTRLGELIESLRSQLVQHARGPKLDPVNPATQRWLAERGFDLSTVLAQGQTVAILPQANLSTGGLCTDLTSDVSPEICTMSIAAAQNLGLRLAGVDILAPDISKDAQDATVLEVNSAPGFDGYATASPETWSRAKTLLCEILETA